MRTLMVMTIVGMFIGCSSKNEAVTPRQKVLVEKPVTGAAPETAEVKEDLTDAKRINKRLTIQAGLKIKKDMLEEEVIAILGIPNIDKVAEEVKPHKVRILFYMGSEITLACAIKDGKVYAAPHLEVRIPKDNDKPAAVAASEITEEQEDLKNEKLINERVTSVNALKIKKGMPGEAVVSILGVPNIERLKLKGTTHEFRFVYYVGPDITVAFGVKDGKVLTKPRLSARDPNKP